MVVYYRHIETNELWAYESDADFDHWEPDKMVEHPPPSEWHFWNGSEWVELPDDEKRDAEGNLVVT